ncbi:helix-turn-helix domain-containing protein [Hyphomicrobium sp. xq]|uniref:Helix-turn-helix domain-containing protein n=1 Tax=Hyphomicrobium album TaxID=2665159 RepID=A0A6I3KN75_9HYPH|nr:AraC family transcriptional regulator [Hyphomicrobium album]MTD95340.1 helix-turn-helix domain-containing protein [Hyphomicrobium album]
MSMSGLLNERAAKQRPRREALWHVDNGWAVFAGPLDHNAPHAHSTAVYLAGLYGGFRLRIAGSGWQTCRSAVVRAGVPYEFDVGGDPLGVIYLEPDMAGADALASLVSGGEAVDGVLIGGSDPSPLRDYFERRPDAIDMRGDMQDVVAFGGRRARRTMDARIARAVSALQDDADSDLSVAAAATAAGLSPSRFQHLFTLEVGVPFRRYRGWHRLRAAIREAAQGASLTTAAHAAGFADQAHFSRAFRRTFGAPPSQGL